MVRADIVSGARLDDRKRHHPDPEILADQGRGTESRIVEIFGDLVAGVVVDHVDVVACLRFASIWPTSVDLAHALILNLVQEGNGYSRSLISHSALSGKQYKIENGSISEIVVIPSLGIGLLFDTRARSESDSAGKNRKQSP